MTYGPMTHGPMTYGPMTHAPMTDGPMTYGPMIYGPYPVDVLTHCNAGWLAFVDYGSATAPLYAAHDSGIKLHVWVDETRPRNQVSKTKSNQVSKTKSNQVPKTKKATR